MYSLFLMGSCVVSDHFPITRGASGVVSMHVSQRTKSCGVKPCVCHYLSLSLPECPRRGRVSYTHRGGVSVIASPCLHTQHTPNLLDFAISWRQWVLNLFPDF